MRLLYVLRAKYIHAAASFIAEAVGERVRPKKNEREGKTTNLEREN